MGETTGFLKWERITPKRRPVSVRLHDWHEVYEPFDARDAQAAGRPLHGLRHPVLQQRLSARQPDPRLERPRLPRSLARRDRAAARDEQLPRVHRPALPGAVRGVVRARHQPGSGHDQAGRGRDRRSRLGRRLDPAGACRRCARASAWPSSAPGRPASPRRSSSRAPATTSSCSSAPTASADCCGTASPSSRWRSGTSTAGSTRCAPRARSSARTRTSASTCRCRSCARSTRRCSPAARRPRATCRSPAASCGGIHQAMEYLPIGNRVQQGDLPAPTITAAGKRVVIIGGGDTGADCLGTAHRQGAASVHQFEILPRPPDSRAPTNPWPTWSNVFRVSSAHEEGGERVYSVNTERFVGDDDGNVRALRRARGRDGRWPLREDRGHRLRAAVRARAARDGLRRPGARGPARRTRRRASTRAATSRATPRS